MTSDSDDVWTVNNERWDGVYKHKAKLDRQIGREAMERIMSRKNYPSNTNYYLVCDPATGQVVKRTSEWKLQLSNFAQIRVDKVVWRDHRAGDQLDTTHIHEPELGRWLEMRALAARKSKFAKEARRVLEELDRDNLET